MPEIKAFSKYLFDETGDKLTFKHNLDVSGDLVIGGNVELSGSNKVVSDVSSSAITAGSVEAGSAVVSGDVAVAGLTSTKYLELNNNVGYMSKSFGDVVYDSGANKKGIRVIMNTEALTPVDVSGTLTGGDVGMFAIRLTLHSPEYGNLEVELFGHLDERASSGYRDLGYRVVSLADSGITIETAKYYITQGIDAATVPFSNDADILQNKSYFFFQLSHASNTQFDYNTVTVVNVTPVDGERTQLPIADYIDIDLYTDASWNSISTIPNADDVFASGDIPEKPLVIPNVDIVENLNVGGAVDVSGNLTVDGVIKAETLQVNDIHHVTTTASDGDMDLSGNLHVSDDISANGAGKIGGDLIVGGDVSANVNLRIGGDVTANSNVGVGGDLTVGGTIDATISRATQNSITTMTGLTSVGTDGVETVFAGDVKSNGTVRATYLELSGNYGIMSKSFNGNDSLSLYTSGSVNEPKKGLRISINTENGVADTGMFNLIVNIHQPYGGTTTIQLNGYLHENRDGSGFYASTGYNGYRVLSMSDDVNDITSVTSYITRGTSANALLTPSSLAEQYDISQNTSYIFIEFNQNSDRIFYYSTVTVENATTSDTYSQLPIKDYIDIDLYGDDDWNNIPTAGFNNFSTIYAQTTFPNKALNVKDIDVVNDLNVGGDTTITGTTTLTRAKLQNNVWLQRDGTNNIALTAQGDGADTLAYRHLYLFGKYNNVDSSGGILYRNWKVTGDLDVTGTINGDVTGDLTGQVLTGSQTNISSIGTTNNVVTFPGSITATQGITSTGGLSITSGNVSILNGGNLTVDGTITGNLNGNASGAVPGSTLDTEITALQNKTQRITSSGALDQTLVNGSVYRLRGYENSLYFTKASVDSTQIANNASLRLDSDRGIYIYGGIKSNLSINDSFNLSSQMIVLRPTNNSHYNWHTLCTFTTGGNTYNNYSWWYNGTLKSYINAGGGGYSIHNFTGQHHNYSPSETVDETYTGFIVSSSGVYRNKFESGNTRSKSSITVNESLPIVVLSGKDKDKKCFGVISDKDDCGDCVEQANGNFVSVFQVKNEDRKLTINSLGEGALWVCDVNGAIENGDYITTSVIPGIGMKQDDDLLHNYTVAKITMDCDFAPQLVHQNKLKLDASGNPTLDEATQEFEFEMAYDESGNPVMEEEYDMKYVKINTSNYVVYNDAALTEEFLRYDHDFAVAQPALVGQVFKMAFVGCTYHCG